VLVDTSVWIRFLANQAPYAAGLEELLSRGDVASHDFVLGELLIGDKGGRKRFLADYARMHRFATVPHDEVVEFVRQRRLHGRGIGWIDTHLLAAAIVGDGQLWTADPRLAQVATELGVNYD
jgi:predicted nucleic acid-binding protein